MSAALDALIANLQSQISALSQRMMALSDAGELTDEDIAQWQDQLSDLLAAYHNAAAIVGNEGKPLTPSQQQSINDTIQTQLDYLANFAGELASGQAFGARDRARADMYAGALRQAFSQMATGGLPLPAYPGEGTICHTNCKCSWDIVPLDGEENYDCYWRRSATDSCGTCIAREREWSPLQIRDGVLQ